NGTACSSTSANACGDGGPATQAAMAPSSLAAGPDGSVYLSDASVSRIRRILPDGTITPAAGNGSNCPSGTLPCGDGGQATAAQLFPTGGIPVGPDGSLYIADGNLGRVRRVRPDGIIVNFAGNGTVCSSSTALCGDGGPATQAQFRGSIDVALGVDGSVYVP